MSLPQLRLSDKALLTPRRGVWWVFTSCRHALLGSRERERERSAINAAINRPRNSHTLALYAVYVALTAAAYRADKK